MKWIVEPQSSFRDEEAGKRARKYRDLQEKIYRVKFYQVEVEADDRWSAVVEAWKIWKVGSGQMQELFDMVSVRKAKKRYQEGWERSGSV